MLLQITAGQGPPECRIAVRLLCSVLLKEFAEAQVLDVREATPLPSLRGLMS